MRKKDYFILACIVLLYAISSHFYINKELGFLIILNIFFLGGMYLCIFALKFLLLGEKIDAEVNNFDIVTRDGNGDGVKTSAKLYEFKFIYQNKIFIKKAVDTSKFNLKIGDNTSIFFIKEVEDIMLSKDIYLRLLFSFLVLYFPSKSLIEVII